MTDRQQQLLDFIIKEYVKTARPVSSSLVAKRGDFDLSSATLRNEMYGLEEDGYLEQLHTSGGRVPTDRAYRYFVNKLIGEQEFSPTSSEKKRIDSVIQKSSENPREMNKSIAQVLSDLSDNLVITGIFDEDDFYKTGLSSLFDAPEFRELDKIFRLTNFFDEFDKIFQEIERDFFDASATSGLMGDFNIFIGRENQNGQVQEETVICAKYYLPHNYRGSLTMVGPKRMDYEKNISLIKYTTDKLNKLAYGR